MKKLFVPRAPAILRAALGSKLIRPLFTIQGDKDVVFLGRHRTTDVAFTYRMGAGFSGDVNRTHPFSVEGCLINVTDPPTFYGQAVVADAATNSIRAVKDGDHDLTAIYGIAVRPYPTQQQTGGMSASIGGAVPPASGVIDVLRFGYVMAQLFGTPAKGGSVYVWADAAGGGELPGQLTTTTTAGSTIGPLTGSSSFNGPPDASGVGEVYLSQ